jgi:hypothetical protein
MGSVNVVENWGNCLDYDPYTEFDIFLPFVGYRQLDTNDVVGPVSSGGCTIDLYYYVNLLTGEFIAAGFSSARHPDNCIFQYAGSFNFTCPITAPNYSAYYKNVLAGAANIVSSAASGAAGGGLLGGGARLTALLGGGIRVRSHHGGARGIFRGRGGVARTILYRGGRGALGYTRSAVGVRVGYAVGEGAHTAHQRQGQQQG